MWIGKTLDNTLVKLKNALKLLHTFPKCGPSPAGWH